MSTVLVQNVYSRFAVGFVRRSNGRCLQQTTMNYRAAGDHRAPIERLETGNEQAIRERRRRTLSRSSAKHGVESLGRGRSPLFPRRTKKTGSARKGLMTVAQEGETFLGIFRRCVSTQYSKVFGELRRGPIISSRNAALLGNGSFVVVAVSFLCTDIVLLRSLNVVAGIMMFAFNALGMERPLWMSMSGINSRVICVHVSQHCFRGVGQQFI